MTLRPLAQHMGSLVCHDRKWREGIQPLPPRGLEHAWLGLAGMATYSSFLVVFFLWLLWPACLMLHQRRSESQLTWRHFLLGPEVKRTSQGAQRRRLLQVSTTLILTYAPRTTAEQFWFILGQLPLYHNRVFSFFLNYKGPCTFTSRPLTYLRKKW